MKELRTIFTSAQLRIIEMMKHIKTDSEYAELKLFLADYYSQKAQEEADRLWDAGILNAHAIEELGKMLLRTPYIHS